MIWPLLNAPHSATVCPAARWRGAGGNRLEYGVAGLPPCVLISHEAVKPCECQFYVKCALAKFKLHALCSTPHDSLEQTGMWLDFLNCPGRVFPLPAAWVQRVSRQ
jgi:hypothetical protein